MQISPMCDEIENSDGDLNDKIKPAYHRLNIALVFIHIPHD